MGSNNDRIRLPPLREALASSAQRDEFSTHLPPLVMPTRGPRGGQSSAQMSSRFPLPSLQLEDMQLTSPEPMPSRRQPSSVPSRHLRYGDAPVIPSHTSTYRPYREQPDGHRLESNPTTPFTASSLSASSYAGFPSASNPSYLPPLPSLSSLHRMPSLQSLPRTDSLQGERSLHNITPPSYGRQSYRNDVDPPIDSHGTRLTSQAFTPGETPLTRNSPYHSYNPSLHGYNIEQSGLSDDSPPQKDAFRRPRRGSDTAALPHLRSTQSSIDLGSSGDSRPSPPSRLYSDPFDPMPSHNFPMPPSANTLPALQRQAPLAAARSRRYLPPPTSLETLIGRSGMLDTPDGRLPGLPPLGSHLPPLSTSTSNSYRYSCETCGKGFDRPSALTIHMHSHTGERPHTCQQCGKDFSVASNLRRHLKVHDNQQ